MTIDGDAAYQVLLAHDARFDGRLFVGVTSTGVYCRPICRVRMPARRNCRFFATPAQAEAESFRPCLKCRPEIAPGPGLPWTVMDASRTLARQAASTLDEFAANGDAPSVADIALRLGVSDRHLRRIFFAEHGVTPLQYLQTRRLLLAKQLLTDTRMPVAQIALDERLSQPAPLQRRLRRRLSHEPDAPAPRGAARRDARDNGRRGRRRRDERRQRSGDHGDARLPAAARPSESARIHRPARHPGHREHERRRHPSHRSRRRRRGRGRLARGSVRGDAGTGPALVRAVARPGERHGDRARAPLARPRRGARDDRRDARRPARHERPAPAGKHRRVRARGARRSRPAGHGGGGRTLARRLVERFGGAVATPWPDVDRVFPAPGDLAHVAIERIAELGIIRSRAGAIQALAARWDELAPLLAPGASPEALVERLRSLPGVGPWTAHYIAMRALGWPDAFPPGDVAALKAMRQLFAIDSARAAAAHAEAWRPWRAYALLRLWNSLGVTP